MVQCSSDCQFVFENCHAVISILVIRNQRSYIIFLRNICSRVYIKTMRFSSGKCNFCIFLSFLYLWLCQHALFDDNHYSWHNLKQKYQFVSRQCQRLRSYMELKSVVILEQHRDNSNMLLQSQMTSLSYKLAFMFNWEIIRIQTLFENLVRNFIKFYKSSQLSITLK